MGLMLETVCGGVKTIAQRIIRDLAVRLLSEYAYSFAASLSSLTCLTTRIADCVFVCPRLSLDHSKKRWVLREVIGLSMSVARTLDDFTSVLNF